MAAAAAVVPAVQATTLPFTRGSPFVTMDVVEKSLVHVSNPPDYTNAQDIQCHPFYRGNSAQDHFDDAAIEILFSGFFRRGVWT